MFQRRKSWPESRCGLGRVCPLSSPAWWEGWRNCCWEASRWDGWYRLSREWRKFTCRKEEKCHTWTIPKAPGSTSPNKGFFLSVLEVLREWCSFLPPESTRCWCICHSSLNTTAGTASRSELSLWPVGSGLSEGRPHTQRWIRRLEGGQIYTEMKSAVTKEKL